MIIYLITNLINGKKYVGKTSKSLSARFSQHCNNKNYNTYIHKAIVKYGRENFSIEEICRCDTEQAVELETFYIKKFHSHYSENGYNITWGGIDNPMNDEVVRRKHKKLMSTDERRELDRKLIAKYNSSEIRKIHDRETSERLSGIYNKNFQSYNDSKKLPIAMIEEDGTIIMKFDSYSDAIKYVSEVEQRKADIHYISGFKRYADKFNKNGKRKKFLGHAWTILL